MIYILRLSAYFLFMLLCTSLCAQQHDNLWLFGYESYANSECYGGSVLDFTTNSVDTFYQYRDMNFDVTNASICDAAGNLLFYTNGIYIANALHEPMENGEGLNPGEHADNRQVYGYILDQGAIILPKPNSDHLYYLFHADKERPNDSLSWRSAHFYYSLVDMSENEGLGSVIEKNEILLNEPLAVGKITATKHSNGIDWWILIRKYRSNEYYRFLLTSDGISNLGVQEVGNPFESGVGQAVFSPNGKKHARYNTVSLTEGDNLNIYDFDRCNGFLSNPVQTISLDSAYSGGAAFSPNSRFLYLSSFNYVFQYDLEADDILATKDTVAIYDGHLEDIGPFFQAATRFFMMQLAPNGKIYFNSPASLKVLHVINAPNEKGEACDIAQHSVRLPTYNAFSLPNFPNYRLGPEEGVVCDSVPTSVEEETLDPFVFKLFPNPAIDKIALNIELPFGAQGEFRLYNAVGQIVLQQKVHEFQSSYVMSLIDIKSGIYFYEVSGSDKIWKKGKLVIQSQR